jgi:hypothetical protein
MQVLLVTIAKTVSLNGNREVRVGDHKRVAGRLSQGLQRRAGRGRVAAVRARGRQEGLEMVKC